jgi:hypothetical protein
MAMTIDIYTQERVRAFRSLMARSGGMAGTFRIKICDPAQPNKLAGTGLKYGDGIPFTSPDGGDRFFSDGLGWYLERGYILILGELLRGAQTIALTGVNGQTAYARLRPGHFITVGEDLHLVTSVTQDVVTPDNVTVKFNPPLRRNHSTGVKLKTAATGLFRFARPEIPSLDLSTARFGKVQIPFVEAWDRL